MASLQVCLFGVVRINYAGLPAITGISPSVKALFAYLILYRHRIHSRDVLASLFWGDSSENRARRSLSTALWRLRKILEPNGISKGTYLVATSMGELGFNRESNHWLDVTALECQARHALSKPLHDLGGEDVRKLEKVLKLYTGDLLEGYYDEWALRQYQTCCQILETELDVAPMAETQTLRTQILQKTGEDRGQSLSQDKLASAQQTYQQLQKAVLVLDKATEQLNRSTRLLEKLLKS